MASHYASIPLFRFLRDSNGSRDQNIVASLANPVEFSIVADVECDIHMLECQIQDAGQFKATGYGKDDPLVNGILMEVVHADGHRIDLLDGEPIRQNNDWAFYGRDVGYFDIGQLDNIAVPRWYFKETTGVALHLHPGDALVMTMRDDMSKQNKHRTIVHAGLVVRGYNAATGPPNPGTRSITTS